MTTPLSVLLVDDEVPILEAIIDTLSELDEFLFDTALSGKEALEKLQNAQYDVIVSDYSMADMNGIELFRQVRRCSETPFILFTGKDDERVVIEALNAGINYYLRKGRDPQVLFTELSHMIHEGACKKRFEDQLKDSEQRFDSLFEHALLPTLICDPDGTCTTLNAAARSFQGTPLGSELLIRNLFQFPGMTMEHKTSIRAGCEVRCTIPLSSPKECQEAGDAGAAKCPSLEILVFPFIRRKDEISAYCVQISVHSSG